MYLKYKDMEKREINTHFLQACINNNLEVVKYLLTSKELTQNANLNARDSFGYNGFLGACEHDSLDVVDYLLRNHLSKKTDILYKKEKNGWTPFMISCSRGGIEVPKYFIINRDMEIDEETIYWLNSYKESSINKKMQATCIEILNILEKREMTKKIYNNLNNSLENKSTKKNKIKI